MKAVILAGGFGTRISEETLSKPKPMVEIGDMPILWHIMKIYSAHGIDDFIICCGYKGYVIKKFFANYFLYQSDITFDIQNNQIEVHQHTAENWRVTLLDTGEKTQTGGRLKRVRRYVEQDDAFCFTYGDGLSDIDITTLIAFHRQQKTLATVTAVQPVGRFGVLNMEKDLVIDVREKPKETGSWINGGFFVLSPQIFDYIDGDETIWEHEPMELLAHDGQLRAYRHHGFWHSMDSLRDKTTLNSLWDSGNPPWKIW